jgi:hypothetical protein
MRDLRQDISRLFDQASHNIVYVRRDLRFRCTCYSERSGEARSDCPICFGTSYHVKIEKHRARRHPNSVPLTLSGVNQETPAGNLIPKAYVYYLEHTAQATENDLILEVEWEGDIPKRIKEKYKISIADAKLGTGGRVEFYQVYTRLEYKGANDDAALS